MHQLLSLSLMQMFRSIFLICSICTLGLSLHGQAVLIDAKADEGVMGFLDEMNNLRYSNNTYAIWPISRQEVSQFLFDLDTSELNDRQLNELKFYQLAFSKDRFDYSERPQNEKLISNPFSGVKRYKQPDLLYLNQGKTNVSVNPVIGMHYHSNDRGVIWQRRIGGDLQANIGRIGLYGSVRDVYELKPMSTDSLLGPKEGGLYKHNRDGSAEFSETRGGITYSWHGGHVGLVRDHVRWGHGYYGTNILDVNTVPFTQLKLHLNPTEWLQFDYLHGSLQSDIIDSSTFSNVGGVQTFDFHNKYIAANMLSVRPWRPLWLSIGNSIVYSSQTPEPTFFIPLMFYKSADHYLNRRNNNAGGNAQMFGAISLRPGSGLHVYSTLFIDELSFRRMLDAERHTNWFSLKSGLRWSNILPNLTLTIEHIRTNAMVYKHYINTTNYENAGYAMGHYLRDNAFELISALSYKPKYWLQMSLKYEYAEKGPDIQDDRTTLNPETGEKIIRGIAYLEQKTWIRSAYTASIRVQPIYRLWLDVQFSRIQHPKGNSSYTIPFYFGNTNTVSLGLNLGL